jgi:hypothetical protein
MATTAPSADFTAFDSTSTVTLQMSIAEAEALRAWLLTAESDEGTSLEVPMVSGVLARLGRTVDDLQAILAIRKALDQAGFDADDVPDTQLLELGRRISQVTVPGLKD